MAQLSLQPASLPVLPEGASALSSGSSGSLPGWGAETAPPVVRGETNRCVKSLFWGFCYSSPKSI